MRRNLMLKSLMVGLSVPLALLGQVKGQKDAQGVQVLKQSLGAMNLAQLKVQDSIAEGSIELYDGTRGIIVFKTSGLKHQRIEISYADQTILNLFDGQRGNCKRNKEKTPFPEWMSIYQGIGHIPLLSRINDYQKDDICLVNKGLETVEGSTCLHFEIYALPTNGTPEKVEYLISEYHIFIDLQTKLVFKTIGYDFSPDAVENRTPVETFYKDYRNVQGVLIPFKISRFIAGQKDSEITMTKVDLNVGVSASEFQIDE